MKKLLFSLISTAFLLSSCSSDDNLTFPSGGNNGTDTKLYDVKVNLKSNFYSVEQTPLSNKSFTKAGNEESLLINNIRIISYKENGDVADDKSITASNDNIINGTVQVDLQLPAGKYTIACFASNAVEKINVFTPSNYESDYYEYLYPETPSIRPNNQGVYYNDLIINVDGTGNTIAQTELQPMWSILVMEYSGAQEMKLPVANLEWMRPTFLTHYYGFRLKTKLAEKVLRYSPREDVDNGGRYVLAVGDDANNYNYPSTGETPIKTYILAKGDNTDMGFKFEYLTSESYPWPNGEADDKYTVVGSKDIMFQGHQLENGKLYNVSIDLEQMFGSNTSNASLGASIDDGIITPGNINNNLELEF